MRLSVGSTQSVRECSELTKVAGEFHVMYSMTCGTIDDWVIGDEFSIVNHDCPEIDEHKQSDVRPLLKWKDKREKMIRYALRESINWVESMGGKRSWHDPLVVWLVEVLVYQRMMQSSVDPVDEVVGKRNEEREL